MSILVVGASEKFAIASAIERARATPVPLDILRAASVTSATDDIKLEDRKPGTECPPSQHLMLGNVRVAFSIEEQPVGLCAHLSLSVAKKGKLPHPRVVEAVAREFGFKGKFMVDTTLWTEEFDPGHRAVNVVWELVPAQTGNA